MRPGGGRKLDGLELTGIQQGSRVKGIAGKVPDEASKVNKVVSVKVTI